MIKKILITNLLIFTFLFSRNTVSAVTDLNIRLIDNKVNLEDKINTYYMQLDDMMSLSGLDWKIKAKCMGGTSIKIKGIYSNICYKEKPINIENNLFQFSIKQNKNKIKNFAVILNGYDKDGALKYSAKENFK